MIKTTNKFAVTGKSVAIRLSVGSLGFEDGFSFIVFDRASKTWHLQHRNGCIVPCAWYDVVDYLA